MVDQTYRLSSTDPFKTFYGAGPPDYWEQIVKQVFKTGGSLNKEKKEGGKKERR